MKEQERLQQEMHKKRIQETFSHGNTLLVENRRKAKEDEVAIG